MKLYQLQWILQTINLNVFFLIFIFRDFTFVPIYRKFQTQYQSWGIYLNKTVLITHVHYNINFMPSFALVEAIGHIYFYYCIRNELFIDKNTGIALYFTNISTINIYAIKNIIKRDVFQVCISKIFTKIIEKWFIIKFACVHSNLLASAFDSFCWYSYIQYKNPKSHNHHQISIIYVNICTITTRFFFCTWHLIKPRNKVWRYLLYRILLENYLKQYSKLLL